MVFDQLIDFKSVPAASAADQDEYGYEDTAEGAETIEAANVPAHVRWLRKAEQIRGARPEEKSEIVVTIRPGLAVTNGWRVYWHEEGITLYIDNVRPKMRDRIVEIYCSLLR